MGDRETFLINQIVKYSQKLDQKGFGANHDGNISAKFEDKLFATPSAVSKGDIVADIIITLDMQGNKIAGLGKPFSEIKLHLAAYNLRSDIKAVVHAHPPFATARGLVNLPIKPALPEAIVSIGDLIPVVDSPKAFEEYNVIMLPGNGVLAVGDCVEQAYLRLELVEHLAKIDYCARPFGAPMELSASEIKSLLEKRASIGLDPKTRSSAKKSTDDPQLDLLTKLITEEISNAYRTLQQQVKTA